MSSRTVISGEVPEKSTCKYAATLKDEAGDVMASASLVTLTLTLYEKNTGAIINSVNGTDILNTGRGTVHATSGLVTITLLPADNAMFDANSVTEQHIMLIQWTYGSGGSKAGRHEVEYRTTNLAKVS